MDNLQLRFEFDPNRRAVGDTKPAPLLIEVWLMCRELLSIIITFVGRNNKYQGGAEHMRRTTLPPSEYRRAFHA
jgi:hypothetical protein